MRQNVYDYAYELKRERKHRNSTLFIVFISVFVFITLFMQFILFPVKMHSDSMGSDIAKNGALFVTPLIKTPVRGDVVYIARSDAKEASAFLKFADVIIRFFTAEQVSITQTGRVTGRPCVRRVLAVPGDTVYMKDYVLYVKPAGAKQFLTEYELASKPYNMHLYSVPSDWDGLGSIGTMTQTVIGRDEYFVLADNRVEAADSRLWGPIKSENILGKVVLQYFPFSKIKIF